MAASSSCVFHSSDVWGWDSQYLKNTVDRALQEASNEYLAYLGPENMAEDRAKYTFGCVKDAALTATCAGEW